MCDSLSNGSGDHDDTQSLRPADAIYAFCIGTHPKKKKIAVCICPVTRAFLVFNTKSYSFRKQAEIECSPETAAFLKKKCYLDTGTIVEFSQTHIDEAIQKGKVWRLPNDLQNRIKFWVGMHGELPGKYEKMINESF